MKPYTPISHLVLITTLSCLFFSSNAQKIKVVDQPVRVAFPFAAIIAQNMKLSSPDSSHMKLIDRELSIELYSPDSAKRWVRIDYALSTDRETVKEVRITGDVTEIRDLYISFYDSKAVNKVRNGGLNVGIRTDGELIVVTTSHMAMYKRVKKFWGVISIEKDDHSGK